MEEEVVDETASFTGARALLYLDALRERCCEWGFDWHEPAWHNDDEVRLTWWREDDEGKLLRLVVTDGPLADVRVFGKSEKIPIGFRAKLLALSDFYPVFFWYFS